MLIVLAILSSALASQENLGVGQMGRFEFDAAAKTFAGIVERTPDDVEARVNLAIATLNRQKEGDSEAAATLIDDVLAKQPQHLRAHYIKGLLHLNGGQPADALEHFRFVAEKDSRDPYAAYYVGQCLAGAGKHEEALAWYAKASQTDPYLRSAQYGSFQSLQRLRRMDEAKEQLAEFQKLKDHLQARLVEFKYTRMGPKAEAVVTTTSPAPSIAPTTGPAFVDAVALPVANADRYAWKNEANITAADIDGDGKVDLFITAGDRNAVLLNRDGSFELVRDHPLSFTEDVNAALWGDYDNDGLTDVYLLRHGPCQLWRQVERGKWKDVAAETKAFGGNTEHVAGAFFDADHDGDLDLFLVNSNAPNELLNNNGDGTFRSLGAETGVAGDGRPSVGVVVNDFDNDGDADILVLKRETPHELWVNDRFWKYHKGENDFLNKPAAVASAVDTDADGSVELYGSRMLDVDGSGVLRPVEFPNFAAWEPVVLDDAAGPSIVAIAGGKPLIMRPSPARAGKYMTLTPSGKSKVADQMRTNGSGVGVKVAARVAMSWIARDTYPSTGSSGQSLQPLAIGLGGATAADFVRLTWPEGLLQTELNLPVAQRHEIAETQRQTSSCPVLFAWDGEKFAFVTDVLGVGGIGFATGPRDEYAPPRPWENLLLPPNLLRPRDGRLVLKLTEPMEEACYLDSARLVAWDVPPGWSMTLDERMATGEPRPTGAARFYRHAVTPSRAFNDRDDDVTARICSADQSAAPVGAVDSRFIGRTREHVLTLTFPDSIEAHAGDPMLLIDGWVEYPYSQTMFAAWQAGAPYDPPTVEALDEHTGEWRVVLDKFGYPAGMPREMSAPLPREKLPPGTRQLRLRSTQEVYFDRIAIAWAEPCPQAKRVELPPATARVADVGFAARTTASQRRPSYDYGRRTPLWDARHLAGFYTEFGDATPLVADTDDAVAIFGPGEEVHLEFSPADGSTAADLPSGWSRRYELRLTGWCKDMDFYTRDGATIEPLPSRAPLSPDARSRRDQLHQKFNTRYRS